VLAMPQLGYGEQLAMLTMVNVVAYASAFIVLLIIVGLATLITRLASRKGGGAVGPEAPGAVKEEELELIAIAAAAAVHSLGLRGRGSEGAAPRITRHLPTSWRLYALSSQLRSPQYFVERYLRIRRGWES